MKINKIRISAVSYLNTLPFLYGINHSKFLKNYIFELDFPSVCAQKLIKNQVDIALIPVAAIPFVEEPTFISDYCLGAFKRVKTVLMFSDVALDQIKSVYLDYQSRTSVNLVRILAEKYWHIKPEWINAHQGFENEIKGNRAGVIIGDRTFKIDKDYQFVYDLSMEWYSFTGLPFVFAAWVANKTINSDFIDQFNQSLQFGLDNIDMVVDEYFKKFPSSLIDLKDYLTNNMSYKLDDDKKKSIKLFYQYMSELNLLPPTLMNHVKIGYIE
jgi:chorismate dehydratase